MSPDTTTPREQPLDLDAFLARVREALVFTRLVHPRDAKILARLREGKDVFLQPGILDVENRLWVAWLTVHAIERPEGTEIDVVRVTLTVETRNQDRAPITLKALDRKARRAVNVADRILPLGQDDTREVSYLVSPREDGGRRWVVGLTEKRSIPVTANNDTGFFWNVGKVLFGLSKHEVVKAHRAREEAERAAG